jgi:GT2 family glycosyltransferase
MTPVENPTLSIVMIGYHCKDLILDCLASLDATAPRTPLEVIVVDNASTDGTVAALNAAHPTVRTVELEQNVGFGPGCNIGVAAARGRYVLLLNPDTIVRPGAIDKLVALAEQYPNAGIWGGKTVTVDGEPVPGSCWRFPTLWSTFCVSVGLSRLFEHSPIFNPEPYGGEPLQGVRSVDVVSGCLLMIRKDLWDKLGGFDPIYFMYSEEVDLCLRARAYGARPVVSSDVEIVHLVGKTQPVRADRMVRLLKGKRTFMLRHWSGLRERLGAALLLGWPLTRYAGLSLVRRLAPRERVVEAAQTWGEVWHRRREWLPGWTTPRA